MSDWRIVADGKQYQFPEKLTLGEQNILARDFGLPNMQMFELTDVRHVSGVLFIAMCRDAPNVARSNVRIQLDGVVELDFVDVAPDEESAEGNPQTPGADAGAAQPGE